MNHENASVSVKDLSEIGISIVGPADPTFSSLLTSNFRGDIRNAAQTLSEVSCFIKNDTEKSIIGYTVRWDMLAADGKVHTRGRNYLAPDALLGQPLDDLRGVIPPHSVGFVSLAPVNEMSKSPEPPAAVQSHLKEAAERIREGIVPFTSVTIVLDNVLLNDGTFAGPDSGNLFAKIKARVEGRRDLLTEFENISRRSTDSAFERLRLIADGPTTKRQAVATATDAYNFQQQKSATELLRMREAVGDKETASRAIALLHRQWINLKKR
jgi:hypothetical protein